MAQRKRYTKQFKVEAQLMESMKHQRLRLSGCGSSLSVIHQPRN